MNQRRSLLASVLLLTAGALSVPSAQAADLHVGSGQTYTTVQAAVSAATAGDVILVHAGSYQEDVDITADGTDSARITLQPAGDGDATITGRITVDGDFWDITDLTIVARAGARGVRLRGDHNRLQGIELSGGDRNGIDGGGIGNEVRACTIHNFDAGQDDAHCIVLNPGAEDWIIADNELYDCSGDTIQLYAGGYERTILNIRIEGNHMYFTGALSRTENAIDVKNADGLVVFGNRMHGFPDNKVVVFQKGPANIDMQCNVMFDGSTGVEFRAEDGGTVENVVFARNLMHDYSSYALKFDGTVGGEVFNNTFVDIGGDGLQIDGAGLANGMVQNNLWSNTGAIEGGTFTADHNGFWQVGSNGIGSGSDVEADPLLDTDYRLGPSSPMIDMGLDVGLPFAGAAPDLGWDETTMASCDTSGAGGAGGGGSSSSGTGGSSSTSSGTGGASSTSSGTGGTHPGATTGTEDDGGCGCRLTGAASGRGTASPWLAGLVTLGLVALGLAARRRRAGDRR
ncbi:MAG: right-handed parallel beta-helix repeat-containing protein [Deltaproteobacteria bacterium]|nr:right-handed parallel beta-helix repeat-containing protein [Deltaproteobacteria bacterium]